MKTFWFAFLFLISSAGQTHAAVPASTKTYGICQLDPEVFQKEILPKIESGIPFELMIVLISDRVMERKMVHVSHNLWDEVVTLGSGDRVLTKCAFSKSQVEVCKALTIESSQSFESSSNENGIKRKIRLLLNPMWPERMARLHLTTRADLENKKLIGIDWKKIADEMPSEKILSERELGL